MVRFRGNPEVEYDLAIRRGDVERLQALAKMKVPPPELALLHAVLQKHAELIPILAEAGADPNQKDGHGETALGHAVHSSRADIVEELLKVGAHPESHCFGTKALGYAAMLGEADKVKVLLKYGANPNAAEPTGLTALLEAARYGYTEIAKMLIGAGANPFAIGPENKNALEVARECGHEEIVRLLLPLFCGKRRAPKPTTVKLMDTIKRQKPGAAKRIIAGGVDVNAKDRFGHVPLMEAIEVESADIVEQLLRGGADPNLPEYHGNSPLDFAALRGDTAIVARLLKAGARKVSSNPVLVACSAGNLELANMLLRAGFSPNQPDGLGHTPLMNAAYAQSPQLVELLLKRGASVDEATPHDGWTALFFAVHAPSVYVSIQHVPSGSTMASAETRAPESGDDRAKTIVKLLLQNGADVNWQDKKGRTAVTYAATAELAMLLLRRGASLHRQDKHGHDARYWLRRNGFRFSFDSVELSPPAEAGRRRSVKRRDVSRQRKRRRRRGKGPH